jgi:large subunit ribosomal protein L4
MEFTLKAIGAGSFAEKLDISEVVFGQEFNEPLVHQVVTAHLAGGRAGTKAQKTRAEVRGGGIKPWRQKGTGRARAGSIRSPIWVGGGATFAASPRSFEQKVNKKMYRGAMRSILSELARQERLIIVKDIELNSHKTKDLVAKLAEFNVSDALIVVSLFDKNLYLAARNLPKVLVKDVQNVDPVSLIKYQHIIITATAIRKLEEVLG